jgi:prepilin-type N-terminal cleavage/methylation domain-containing protein
MKKRLCGSTELAEVGFTLVEILVVIAIIAMMLAILLPGLARSRQIAYRITCLNNLKQLGVAVEAYVQTYGYYPVCLSDVNESWSDFLADKTKPAGQMLGVPVSLWPFHKTAALYYCPVLRKAGCDISYCYNWLAGRRLAADEDLPTVSPSYIPPAPVEPKEVKFHLLSPEKVKSPSMFVLLYDQPVKPEQAVTSSAGYDPYKDIDPDDSESLYYEAGEKGFMWYYNGWPTVGPHTEGYDILFADSHTKWHKKWSGSEMSRKPD